MRRSSSSLAPTGSVPPTSSGARVRDGGPLAGSGLDRRLFWIIAGTVLLVLGVGSGAGVWGNTFVGAVGGVALGVLVYLHPPAAAWAMFALMPFIIGFERGQFVPEMRLNEPLMIILLLALGAHALVHKGALSIRPTRLDGLMVMITVAGSIVPLVVAYGRLKPVGGGDYLYAMGPLKLFVAYLICRLVIRNERELDVTLKISLIAASIVSLIAVADSMNIGGFAYWLHNYIPSSSFIIDDGRGGSTFGNPIGMGVYATFHALIAMTYFALRRGGPVLMRLALACCIAGVLGSGQVTGVIALGAAAVAFAYINGGVLDIARRLLPMVAVSLVLLWPLIAQRLDQFDGYEVTSEQRNDVEFSEPRDQPRELYVLNPGSSWDVRLYNLETFFFPEFEHRPNILWGVKPEARVPAPGDPGEWIWIESGYVWLIWIGGVPYAFAFTLFVVWGAVEYRRVARRGAELVHKIAGVIFCAMVVLGVVQGFDPHLTLRGTADLLYPLLGATAFLGTRLTFWDSLLQRSAVGEAAASGEAATGGEPLVPLRHLVATESENYGGIAGTRY